MALCRENVDRLVDLGLIALGTGRIDFPERCEIALGVERVNAAQDLGGIFVSLLYAGQPPQVVQRRKMLRVILESALQGFPCLVEVISLCLSEG